MTPADIAKLPYRKNAGVVLRNQAGLIFAGQRLDNKDAAWQMPQGGIDDGEAPQQAALRELEEETGVAPTKVKFIAQTDDWLTYDLPVELIPNLWKGRFRGQAQLWFLFDFIGDDTDINIATKEPEFSEWQWLSAPELVQKIVPFKVEMYQQVFSAFDL